MAVVLFTLAIVGALSFTGIALGAEQVGEQVERVAESAKEATIDAANASLRTIKSDPWTWLHIIGACASLLGMWAFKVLRPGVLEGDQRSVDNHPSIVWFASGALVFLGMLAGGVVAGEIFDISKGSSDLKDQAILAIGNYLVAIPTALLLSRLLGMSSPESGLSLGAKDITPGLLAIVLAWPIVQCAALLAAWLTVKFGGSSPDDIAHSTLEALKDDPKDIWAISMAAMAVIGAPLVEEFVFRGCLQSALRKLFGGAWIAIILTSALFAGMHVEMFKDGRWHAVAALFVFGLSLGFAFERTKKFTVPVVMHVIFNLVNIVITLAK